MNKTNSIVSLIVLVIAAAAILAFVGFNHKAPILTTVESAVPLSNVTSQVDLGNVQNVTWNSQDISSDRVSVNVIRKVSDNPAQYVLVRTVATSTENDGSATWVPSEKDLGDNLYVEIGCTQTSSACHASVSNSQLAVLDSSLYLNTASAYQAIEAAANK